MFNQLLSLVHEELIYNPGQKCLGRLYNLTSFHFKVQKVVFPFTKYSLFPPIQTWDIPEQLRAQTLSFCSLLDQGVGRKEGKNM